MAPRQIPNLTPVVFLSPTAQLEIVQDGTTYRASAGQIAQLSGVGGAGTIKIVNDLTDTTSWFPLFAKQFGGDAATLYTSDSKYQYLPTEGRLSSQRVEATQGLVFNAANVGLDYTFPVEDNATSCGPLTLTAVITIPNKSEWMVL